MTDDAHKERLARIDRAIYEHPTIPYVGSRKYFADLLGRHRNAIAMALTGLRRNPKDLETLDQIEKHLGVANRV